MTASKGRRSAPVEKLPPARAKRKLLPAKPLEGEVDFVELRRSIMKRTSKTRARLAE
jgi:hypothetical protein